jgi:RNA polymerase sigma-70 factor (ECF subfamily)
MTQSQLSAARHNDAQAEGPWAAWRDEDLLAAYARENTHEAFEELFHRYEGLLHAYLRRYLGDGGLAEDAFQATFLEVHLHCREFDPRRRFKPWVYRIATTRAIDLLRRNRRHKPVSIDGRWQSRDGRGGQWPSDDLPDLQARPPLEQLELTESRQRLRVLVDSLPVRLRNVVVLVTFRGLGYQEAADALGIPRGTVKSRMHNAIFHLRRTVVAAA